MLDRSKFSRKLHKNPRNCTKERGCHRSHFHTLYTVIETTFAAEGSILSSYIGLVPVFSDRKRSCRKVIFSQTSLCSQVGKIHASWERDLPSIPPGYQTWGPTNLSPTGPDIKCTKTRTVSKWAVRILLECFLIYFNLLILLSYRPGGIIAPS